MYKLTKKNQIRKRFHHEKEDIFKKMKQTSERKYKLVVMRE